MNLSSRVSPFYRDPCWIMRKSGTVGGLTYCRFNDIFYHMSDLFHYVPILGGRKLDWGDHISAYVSCKEFSLDRHQIPKLIRNLS